MTTQPDCNDPDSGLGRVLAVFRIPSRGTVVAIEITGGTWRAGAQLMCAKGAHHIHSIDAIDGKNLPLATFGIVIDHNPVEPLPEVGEAVRCVFLP